ncbi:MAG: 1-deoxy-D-xylulose-5-phosphate synthase, partial [Magnetococcus sp. XQGC-1]
DLSFLRAVPDLVLMAPADENELRSMLATAISLGKPVAIRYPKGTAIGLERQPAALLPVGVGRCLREGTQVALAAVGSLVHPALQAAAILENEGISVQVCDFRYIKPLDEQLLRKVARLPYLATLEENTVCGGFGSAVLEFLARDGLLDGGKQVRTWGLPDRFIPQGGQEALRAELQLDAEGIAERVRQWVR